jgi:uncharacterized membrane protein YphA (DoxX/SURF4 family)
MVRAPGGTGASGFCLATAVLFHLDFADHIERSMFFKDLALAGGLLWLAASEAETALVAGPAAARRSLSG